MGREQVRPRANEASELIASELIANELIANELIASEFIAKYCAPFYL